MRRRGTAALVAVMLLAGCSSSHARGTSANPTPTVSSSPSDALDTMNLALSDLPDGWADMPYSGGYGGQLADCAGLADVLTTSHSPRFMSGRSMRTRVVLSEVVTVSTPTVALDDVRLVQEQESCVRDLAKDDPQVGLKQGAITVTRLPRDRFGSASYVLRTSEDWKGLVNDIEYTVELLASGRRELLLVTVAENGAFDPALRARLLDTLVARLTAGT